MKTLTTVLACAGLPLAAACARAQTPDPATLAVSREITMYHPPGGSAATLAVSREVTMYGPPGGTVATLAVSREVTMYGSPGAAVATLANSREITMYVPPGGLAATLAVSREVTAHFEYTPADAALALRIAAGLAAAPSPTGRVFGLLNLNNPAANTLDILDAAAIGYHIGHPEAAP